jgi:16S rRNA (cytidine1402-2'-O)-methyltransferase
MVTDDVGAHAPDAAPPDPSPLAPGLYLVATPIGNLADITLRALACLRAVDLIACEDTRHSQRLLARHGIRKPLLSLHGHNEAARSHDLLSRVRDQGARIAYLTDAGMPAVSDPGERLVHLCIRHGIPYDVLPGPSAVTTALVGSGLGVTPFWFGGFLPVKRGQKTAALQAALERDATSVFFESPHRLAATLALLASLEADRLVAVARELTKVHQDYRRDSASALAAHYEASPPKGEICLLVSPKRLPSWLREPGGNDV